MSETKTTSKAARISDLIKEFESISKYFESEELDIDTGIKNYERGMQLAKEIKTLLEGYELKIQEIQNKYQLGE